jgi:predicted MFS family arabinose efflux permease
MAPQNSSSGSLRPVLSERKLLLLIGAVQFVNVLDFVMVMPLGPDFARALGIPVARLGIVGGAYTASAAVSGVLGAVFLDRFDRRKALAFTLLGLVLGTLAGGFAWDLTSLIVARVIAGAFGGPATSLAYAIIADLVPVERRGRAMGAVMGAFSVASVLGIPIGLELARVGGWQTPFFAVAGLGAVIASLAIWLMPPVTGHLRRRSEVSLSTLELLSRPLILLALTITALAMVAQFAIVPNLSAYFQENRGYPRAQLGLLYLIGGAVSFVTVRLAGRITDRVGPARTAALGTALFVFVLIVGFAQPIAGLPVLAIFVAFMVTSSSRFVPMSALSSRVPGPAERARYMSVQSCVQHLASAAGAMLASTMLESQPDGALVGMERVAVFTAVLSALVPLVMFMVEARVRRTERSEVVPEPDAPLRNSIPA